MNIRIYPLIGFIVGWMIHFLLLNILPAPDLFDKNYQTWMHSHIILGILLTIAVMCSIYVKFGTTSKG